MSGFTHDGGQALLDEMDKTIPQKVAVCAAHLMLNAGSTVLDAGCANGMATAYFAMKHPDVHVIGVDYDADYIRTARDKFGHIPNLEFIEADLRALDLGARKLDAILNLSILHEPYSYSGYRSKTVEEIIAAELKNLKQGGVIINRDFMLPDDPQKMVYLALPDDGEDLSSVGMNMNMDTGGQDQDLKTDDLKALSYAAFFELYAREALRFDGGDAGRHVKGFFYEDVTAAAQAQSDDIPANWRVFAVEQGFAWEYIWRMQYRERFYNEAEEKYAFWTHRQHREVPQDLGARVSYSAPYENPWIMENWYRPSVRLFDENFKALPVPPSNFISILEKKTADEAAFYREHQQAPSAPSYLRVKGHKNTVNGAVYDLAQRPGNDVVDVLPYSLKDGELTVLAKSGYPRPIANIKDRMIAPNLDGKMWSGHMIEPFAVANIQSHDDESAMKEALRERVGLSSQAMDIAGAVSLHYYPAAAELDERVHAFCVEIDDMPAAPTPMMGGYSGFSNEGEARPYNAQSLLQAAQAGMLPEARLETNIYALMRGKGVTPKPWIGPQFEVSARHDLPVKSVDDVVKALKGARVFEDAPKPSGWLDVKRSVFHEIAKNDTREEKLSAQELEFIMPRHGAGASTNSAILLFLSRDEDSGEVMIAVQKATDMRAHFAAVQSREGHSGLLSVPGMRLPPQVTHIQDVPSLLSQRFNLAAESFTRLGEAYFPSLGVTPSRVFPYVVTDVNDAILENYDFVPLRDVFGHIEDIHDLHVMTSVFRSVHALGLWDDYQSAAPKSAARP